MQRAAAGRKASLPPSLHLALAQPLLLPQSHKSLFQRGREREEGDVFLGIKEGSRQQKVAAAKIKCLFILLYMKIYMIEEAFLGCVTAAYVAVSHGHAIYLWCEGKALFLLKE